MFSPISFLDDFNKINMFLNLYLQNNKTLPSIINYRYTETKVSIFVLAVEAVLNKDSATVITAVYVHYH